jgi:hypothetical protein
MNKKAYLKPAMSVVKIQHQSHILAGSLRRVSNNVDLNYGGGGTGEAQSRGYDVWEDDDE